MAASLAKRLRLILLSSGERAEIVAQAERLYPRIAQFAEVSQVDLREERDLSRDEFDLVVVLGGDGSILQAVHQMGSRQRPIVGVNLGKLGFLADLSVAEFERKLELICSGTLRTAEHLMYQCQLWRGKTLVGQQLGLNEVAVLSGAPFAILRVDLYVDEELVTTYSCDGLIISTPVGSTAHSLSAGGPILRRDLQAMVISPVSAHTLTNRPVVDRADRVYDLVVPTPHEGTTVVTDGRVFSRLLAGDRIRIQKAEATFQSLLIPDHSYYRTLREKLGWGGQVAPKRETSN